MRGRSGFIFSVFHKLFLAAIVLVFAPSFCCICALAQQPAPKPDENTLAEFVQDVLGIQPTGANLLPPLADVVQNFSNDPQAAQKSVESLVHALNAGADPNLLSSLIISGTHIDDYFAFQKGREWKYGNYVLRNQIWLYLQTKAMALQRWNPQQATQFARAALLLAAHEDFQFGEASVKRMVDDEDFVKLLDLNPANHDKLKQWLTARNQAGIAFGKAMYNFGVPALDLKRGKNGPLAPETLRQAIVAAENIKPLALRLQDQYYFANAFWQLLEFARKQKDETAVKDLRAFFVSWKQTTTRDTTLYRWLGEALDKVPGN